MEWDAEEGTPLVWVSPISNEGQPRLTLRQCPVSTITGQSAAFVQDFMMHRIVGDTSAAAEWPARRVDAFAVLQNEQRAMRNMTDDQR